MIKHDIIFRTRLAARLLGYFLVLAIAPILAFGFFSNQQVVRESDAIHARYSLKSAEILNQLYFSRLKQLSDILLQEARYLDLTTKANPQDNSLLVASGFFSDLKIIPKSYALLRDEEARHMELGNTILRSVRDNELTDKLVMLAQTPDGNVLTGVIKPEALWGAPNELPVSGDTTMQIYTPGGGLLISSKPNDHLPHDVLADILGQSRGRVDLGQKGTGDTVYFRELFLAGEFVFPRWTLVLRQPRDAGAVNQTLFITLFPLMVIFSIGLVLYATLVIIRRTFTPLSELKDMAQRISRRDFDARVEISSGDEIEELGQTLNAMAGQLKYHFCNLEAQTAIDRKILSSMDVDSVVDSALRYLIDTFGADAACLMLLDRGVFRVFKMNRQLETHVTTVVIEDKITRRLWGRLHNAGWSDMSRIPELKDFPLHDQEKLGLACQVPMHGPTVGVASVALKNSTAVDETCLQLTGKTLNQIAVAFANIRLLRELQEFNWGTLEALARAVDEKSAWTLGHSNRVAALAIDLAEAMGWSEGDLDTLHRAALLHDLGKIGIPNEILDKPGRLDEAEFAIIRTHPDKGAKILEPVRAYAAIIPMIRYHHERYDGSGYPCGLVGQDIPEGARILAVVDVYDALVTSRPYREGWSTEKVNAYLQENAGTLFDPDVVKVFLTEQ